MRADGRRPHGEWPLDRGAKALRCFEPESDGFGLEEEIGLLERFLMGLGEAGSLRRWSLTVEAETSASAAAAFMSAVAAKCAR
jgi:hypothetical protein